MSDETSNQGIRDPEGAANVIETDYEIGQDNISPFGLDIHNPVFVISSLLIIVVVILSLMFQDGATAFFGWLRPFLIFRRSTCASTVLNAAVGWPPHSSMPSRIPLLRETSHFSS